VDRGTLIALSVLLGREVRGIGNGDGEWGWGDGGWGGLNKGGGN